MVEYKYTYFNGRGLAEINRYIFEAAGVPYEDVRLSWDDWPAIKPTMPFGKLIFVYFLIRFNQILI